MSRRWTVLTVSSLGIFMVFLDGTIVNVAFPAIHASYPDSTQASLSWVLNAYSVVFAGLLLASGRVADLVGRRRVFLLGLGIFTAGSVACGAAPTLALLEASRVVQAAGGALMLPTSLALILPEFPITMRATAVGIWGAVGAVAAASGPSVGSVVVEFLGWRWAFLVNLPVGIIATLLGRRFLRESRDENAAGWPDLVGAVAVTAGTALVALAVVEGNEWGWTSPRVALAFLLGLVALTTAVLRSRRHRAPVLDLALFRVRSFSVANVATLLFGAAFAGMLLIGVLFMTGVWHYSVLHAGLGMTPGPLMAATFAPIAGRLADRFGHRVLIVPGAFLFAAGILLYLTRVTVQPDYLGVWLPAALLGGIGVGLTMPTLGSAAAASLPSSRFGAGSAISSTARQAGFVLGVALLVAVLGTPSRAGALDAFHRGWILIAGLATAAGVVAAGLGTTVQRAAVAPAPAMPAAEAA